MKGAAMPTGARISVGIAGIGGALLVWWGVWAFFWPRSFYDNIATFEPYNEHFMHDIGAFQIGLGLTLLLALRMRDALFVAMVGVGSGAALHAIAHITDRNDGGRSSDPGALGLLAVLLLVGAALRWKTAVSGASGPDRESATHR